MIGDSRPAAEDMTPPEVQSTPGPGARPGARPVPAGLHLIATPIGAARDITLHALDLLAGADVLAAEDTRTLRKLMEIHGLSPGARPLIAYHDHNGARARPGLMRALAEGRSVVYASEAGTPLVADPGYQLVRAALAEGHPVHAAPGPSAVLAALAVSGLPTDRFLFAGFPPASGAARARWLAELAPVQATLVLYESPKRVHKLLTESMKHLGNGRQAAVCRELTKRFETVTRGTLAELAEAFAGKPVKGEIVVVVDRPDAAPAGVEDLEEALRAALARVSLKDAVAEVAAALGVPRREVYQAALKLAGER
ncbi:ribosomal RNA small subunit methyltransferase I [Allgaiera indica]|uniref:Ribosomal RNA small subunit methyltransferase I n=2 Tax=Allgaiera indica TaxID=765699 RepID=A0AAN4UP11_9RHOB|nr:ribosomal RNA small subunit methyltransferase I [Allgaiera indica]SDW02784.1 16S rRNA (cytidine1402-2'-O)-methyltransferase [Allgaiera indica]